MDIKLKKAELELLLKADEELFTNGYTEIKCPRCGNKIICNEQGNSYTIRCETHDCIKTDFRGI